MKKLKTVLTNQVNQKSVTLMGVMGALFLTIGNLSLDVHCVGMVYEPEVPQELLK